MKLFRRKNNNEVLPDEVQDYYRTEQRDRMGAAWLLAAGGFILTAAVVVGLFFGGRWAYQSFFTDGNGVDMSSDVDGEESSNGLNGLPDVTDSDETTDTDSVAEEESDTDIDIEDGLDSATDATSPAAEADAALPRTGPATQE